MRLKSEWGFFYFAWVSAAFSCRARPPIASRIAPATDFFTVHHQRLARPSRYVAWATRRAAGGIAIGFALPEAAES